MHHHQILASGKTSTNVSQPYFLRRLLRTFNSTQTPSALKRQLRIGIVRFALVIIDIEISIGIESPIESSEIISAFQTILVASFDCDYSRKRRLTNRFRVKTSDVYSSEGIGSASVPCFAPDTCIFAIPSFRLGFLDPEKTSARTSCDLLKTVATKFRSVPTPTTKKTSVNHHLPVKHQHLKFIDTKVSLLLTPRLRRLHPPKTRDVAFRPQILCNRIFKDQDGGIRGFEDGTRRPNPTSRRRGALV